MKRGTPRRSLCVSSSLTWLAVFICQTQALSVTRRKSLAQTSAAILTASGISPQACSAEGLASKLSLRDPAQLKNSVFNIPPAAQVSKPPRGSLLDVLGLTHWPFRCILISCGEIGMLKCVTGDLYFLRRRYQRTNLWRTLGEP